MSARRNGRKRVRKSDEAARCPGGHAALGGGLFVWVAPPVFVVPVEAELRVGGDGGERGHEGDFDDSSDFEVAGEVDAFGVFQS